MPDWSQLETEELERQICKLSEAYQTANNDPSARAGLKALLLERERRQIAGLSDTQLAAAIQRYEGKASGGDKKSAEVLGRLQKENVERELARSCPGAPKREPPSPSSVGIPSGNITQDTTAPLSAAPHQSAGAATTRRWLRFLSAICILACLGLLSFFLGQWGGYRYGCWQATEAANSSRKQRQTETLGLQPSGYYTSSSLGGGSFGKTLQVKDKAYRFLVVNLSVPSEWLMLSTPELLAALTEEESKVVGKGSEAYVARLRELREKVARGAEPDARKHHLDYSPNEFMLLLGDGSGYWGDAIRNPADSFGGFVTSGWRTETFEEPPEMQTLEVAWVLPVEECKPPLRLRFDGREPVEVPDAKP